MFVRLSCSVLWLFRTAVDQRCGHESFSQSSKNDLESSQSPDLGKVVVMCGSSFSFLIFGNIVLFCAASSERGTNDVLFATTYTRTL